MHLGHKVWDTRHEFGDVVIASFESEADAKLFAKTSATKLGGYRMGLLVGTTFQDRKSVPVD
jgi:hypothetical protein